MVDVARAPNLSIDLDKKNKVQASRGQILELHFEPDPCFCQLWQSYRGNMWAIDNFYRISLTDSLEQMLQETIDTGRSHLFKYHFSSGRFYMHMKLTTEGLEFGLDDPLK